MAGLTDQAREWTGDFGRLYTDRNDLGLDGIDHLYRNQFGISRRELNQEFIGNLPRSLAILEVGCNIGNQLAFLAEQGFNHLTGIEIQNYAIQFAQQRLPQANLIQGSALALPFSDQSFDLVFTSGVLIHIHPHNLAQVITEIYRVTRAWIWGMEYFAVDPTEIIYRGQHNLLWKAPFAQIYQDHFPDLILAKERRLSYQENNANIDSMYLLKKYEK